MGRTAKTALFALLSFEAAALAGCARSKPRAPEVVAAAPNARRLVLDPEAVAFVTSEGSGAGATTIALGAEIGPRARILIRFPRGSFRSDEVSRAYLVLQREPSALAGPGDVALRASQIVEAWSSRQEGVPSWASPPRASELPSASARVRSDALAPIRIDVTDHAIDLGRKTSEVYGLRIEADGEGHGLPVATGLGRGAPPRLEVFLK
jgi:hypothetical protein